MCSTEWLQAHPERYPQPERPVPSLWESSTSVPSIRFAPPFVEDDQAKVSAEGTRLIWPTRVAIALLVRGTRLVDTSGGSTGFTDAGSSLIDMGNQFANSQSIGSSDRSKEHVGTLAPRREDSFPSQPSDLTTEAQRANRGGEPALSEAEGDLLVRAALRRRTKCGRRSCPPPISASETS